ncbi:hypothetical protein [Cupriavidus plantarum]|uniref:hypothetical protein n=1 Tax=Cupriavidus plantarum TaxID=942865 RepID=UPI0015C6A0D5|nr:hypothetical protein [Cupriavidus plantarum]NYH99456.1 hypothetical protein [Cupriavidus plantarum]CAG2143706.1 hypothetical protein LMG26296_03463 [Cupriavidus plantarum]SMR65754.1 hypothetical protein SAMN05421735_0607 [Cupriavidus plantarum]
MKALNGYKILYEVIAMPKGKWAIMIEVIHRESGTIVAQRHNPFPVHGFDTKLEALGHVNRHVETLIDDDVQERDARRRRIV